MNRTAILATLLLLVLCASPSAAAPPVDPVTFLVAFTPDSGRLVIASHRGGIKVLSVPDLKEVRSFSIEGDRRLRSAAVSPNARWLATDDVVGDLRIWDLESGEARPAVPIKHSSYNFPVFVFGPDDDMLFVYQDRLSIWDVKQGREVDVMNGVEFVQMMTVSPDGRSLVVYGRCSAGRVGGNVCVCSIDQKNIVVAADLDDKDTYPADLVYTNDDRILLTLRLPSSESGSVLHMAPSTPTFQSRFLNPGDLEVLETTVIDPGRGWQYPGLRSAPTPQLEVVSPDGKWKATAYQKRLYLYRMTGESRRTLEKYIPIP